MASGFFVGNGWVDVRQDSFLNQGLAFKDFVTLSKMSCGWSMHLSINLFKFCLSVSGHDLIP